MGIIAFEVSSSEMEKFIKESVDYMKGLDMIKPVVVMADSPHASFLEYGTRGVGENSDPYVSDNLSTSARESIFKWVEDKFQNVPAKQRKTLAWSIYQKVMTRGIDAHPFLQPAMDTVLGSYNVRDWFEEGKTTWQLGERIVEKAQDILLENGNNWNWDVYKSLKVEEYRA